MVILMDLNYINIITLAYIGDAVYELFIREMYLENGIYKVDEMQKEVTKFVCAKGQVKFLNYLMDNNKLTEDELDIVKRGRNYNRNSHPKNTDIITYKMSTGFEALVGSLYLSNKDRLSEILSYVKEM